jgi:hypothetical protein
MIFSRAKEREQDSIDTLKDFEQYIPAERIEEFRSKVVHIGVVAYMRGRIRQLYRVIEHYEKYMDRKDAELTKAWHPEHKSHIAKERRHINTSLVCWRGKLEKMHKVLDKLLNPQQ